MLRSHLSCCLLAASLLTLACSGDQPPVGRVEVVPAVVDLLYPGFSDYTLNWTAEASLPGSSGDVRVAMHLLGNEGQILRTFDHALDFEWSAGATSSSERMLFQSALAPALEAGDYELRIGLYDAAGNSWDVASNNPTVRAAQGGTGFPAFYFSPEWLPVEGGTDQQILGRRWLKEDGLVRLGELTAPGTLWLQVGVPRPREGEQELILDEGETEPRVTVSSSCGGSETLIGSGSHPVRIPIQPDAEGVLSAECEIALDANFALVSLVDRVHRTVALESLSWQADAS